MSKPRDQMSDEEMLDSLGRSMDEETIDSTSIYTVDDEQST